MRYHDVAKPKIVSKDGMFKVFSLREVWEANSPEIKSLMREPIYKSVMKNGLIGKLDDVVEMKNFPVLH